MQSSSGNEDRRPLLERTLSEQDIEGGRVASPSPSDVRNVENDAIPETAVVGRNISWASAFILIISRVIGSGIFATPGTIVRDVGSIGLALSLWVLGAALAACGLAIGLEYGCMLPRSGGTKVYLEFTYRRPRFLATTIISVQTVLLGFTATNCIVFGQYVLYAVGATPTEFRQKFLAAALLTAVIIIHGCFLRAGIFIQNILGFLKIALVLFIALTGLWVVIFNHRDTTEFGQGTNSWDWDELWTDSRWEWGIVATSLFKVLYSFAGLENVNNVMNEVKNPVRTLKTAAPTALLLAFFLYMLINVAYFVAIPLNEVKQSKELIAAIFFEKVFGAGFGRTALSLAIAISALGNVMVVTFSHARVNQEIARQGFLPFADLISSSRPFNSPLGGLIVHYIPSMLVILLPPPGDVYTFILDVEGYPGTIIALSVSVGLLLLRRRRPDLKRPYKAWLPAALLRIFVSVLLVAAPFFPPKEGKGDVSFFYATYAVVGISILALSGVYWYVWTVLIPKWNNYSLEEETATLEDGTTITRLIKIKRN